MLEITAKSGEIAKFNAQFTAQSISDGSAVEPAGFVSDVVPFYNVSPGLLYKAKAISIKIERPYSADDFVLSNRNRDMVRTSKYISDMRQMKISGTIALARNSSVSQFIEDSEIALTFWFGETFISVSDPFFFTNKEISISGRSPVTKTISWTCSSSALNVS